MSDDLSEKPPVSPGPDKEKAEDWGAFDEVSESFDPKPIKVIEVNGLVTLAPENPDAEDIPPLSPETLVCLGTENRSRCAHYGEQLTQADFNASVKVLLRFCTARRNVEGAFMSLVDRGMWACTLRSPRDEDSEQLIRDMNDRKIREGRGRELVPLGDFLDDPVGGIFGSNK